MTISSIDDKKRPGNTTSVTKLVKQQPKTQEIVHVHSLLNVSSHRSTICMEYTFYRGNVTKNPSDHTYSIGVF